MFQNNCSNTSILRTEYQSSNNFEAPVAYEYVEAGIMKMFHFVKFRWLLLNLQPFGKQSLKKRQEKIYILK